MNNIEERFPLALTYDDISFVPQFSQILPRDARVESFFARGMRAGIPIMASAMDSVTMAPMAIALARKGGLGVIHKNLSPVDQAHEVDRVKRAQSGVILDPATIRSDATLRYAKEFMQERNVSGLPIVDGSVLVGLLTARDIRFETRLDQPVSALMQTRDKLVTVPMGISADEARELLHRHRIEKLLVVDPERPGTLLGLITVRDLQRVDIEPEAVLDAQGRLQVGAAIGPGPDLEERVERLLAAGVDLLVVDTAHGHSQGVIDTVEWLRRRGIPDHVKIMAGNVVTAEGTNALIDAGADAVKVGVGPGSICTTRIVSGVGVPQATAVMSCVEAAAGRVSIVADGGIKYSGDMAKAIALGASVIMIGSLLAGTDESPGELILFRGRSYKMYRGMGSLGAMREGGKTRYGQSDTANEKLVPEGIEGRVPYRGPVAKTLDQMVGGLKAAMGYTGAPTIPEFVKRARFVRQTANGLRESHPHDVEITEEAPNYRAPS